jgi:hypothetical protein
MQRANYADRDPPAAGFRPNAVVEGAGVFGNELHLALEARRIVLRIFSAS